MTTMDIPPTPPKVRQLPPTEHPALAKLDAERRAVAALLKVCAKSDDSVVLKALDTVREYVVASRKLS